MSLLQAIILGIVQGLTEFIPISSTAHLVLAMRAMNLPLTPEQTTASIAVIQLGTLLAVLIYFARDIWSITIGPSGQRFCARIGPQAANHSSTSSWNASLA